MSDQFDERAKMLLRCETGCFGRGSCYGCIVRSVVALALRKADEAGYARGVAAGRAAQQADDLAAVEAVRQSIPAIDHNSHPELISDAIGQGTACHAIAERIKGGVRMDYRFCRYSPSGLHQWIVTRWLKDTEAGIWTADYFHCQWCMAGYPRAEEQPQNDQP